MALSTEEQRADIETRMESDLASVLEEHGLNEGAGDCLLDCLTDAAMRHVEELLVKVEWHE